MLLLSRSAQPNRPHEPDKPDRAPSRHRLRGLGDRPAASRIQHESKVNSHARAILVSARRHASGSGSWAAPRNSRDSLAQRQAPPLGVGSPTHSAGCGGRDRCERCRAGVRAILEQYATGEARHCGLGRESVVLRKVRGVTG